MSAQEAEKVRLSLQEAQQMAVERNVSLQNAAIDVRVAEANKWQAISNMLPQVNLGVNYSNYCGYEMDLGGMKLSMPPYVDMGLTTSMTFSPAMLISKKISDISLKMSDISLKQTERQTKDQVKTLYFSALVSEEILNLLNGNLENLGRLEAMTQRSVDVGMAEQTSADQIRVQVATLENNILSTRRSLEMLYNTLRLQLNLDVDAEIELTQSLDDLLAIDAGMGLIREGFDMEGNYNWQLLKESTELTKQQLNAAKMGTLPSVTAMHQFTQKKYLSDERTMNMTPPNMINVSVKIPIFTSLNKSASIKSARLAYEKQLNTMAETERQLNIQYRQLCYNLASAYDSYNTQKANLEVSQNVFDNIARKYERGAASAMEVTNSGTSLIGAQSSYIQAVLSFVQAQVELEQLLNK